MLLVVAIVAWLCSAVRAAVLTVERTRVEQLAEAGDRRAQVLLGLILDPFRSIAPLNLIYTASLIALALALSWHAFESTVDQGTKLAEVALALFGFVVCKIAFDFIAIARALAVSLASAPILNALVKLALPLTRAGDWLVRKAKGPRATARPGERLSTNDIQIIMTKGEEPRKLDLIDADEREMIAGIIEMGQRYASEIMIPRPDIVALDVNASLDDALDVAIKYGHSRLPVYEEDIDHIVGILHVKDLLQALRHPDRPVKLKELLRPVHYVPETAKADDILRDLMRNRVHMAIVVDEYGGTSGALTIEDVLEEIVGEIRDEYDATEEAPYTRISEDTGLFKGSVPVSEVNQVMGADLPTGETDTLGGLIYTRLGRLPRLGDNLRIGSLDLTVVGLSGRRINQVKVVRVQEGMPKRVGNDEKTHQFG